MKATKLQKRAIKAIARAESVTKTKKQEHVVIRIGESFNVVPLTDRAETAQRVAHLCGAEMIYSATIA